MTFKTSSDDHRNSVYFGWGIIRGSPEDACNSVWESFREPSEMVKDVQDIIQRCPKHHSMTFKTSSDDHRISVYFGWGIIRGSSDDACTSVWKSFREPAEMVKDVQDIIQRCSKHLSMMFKTSFDDVQNIIR